MRALIMAGGGGTRLNRGEKPLLLIRGRPMLSYIVDAFSGSGCEPVVVISPKTPMTANWCRARNIALVRTPGVGFIDDMIHAVKHLDEDRPVIISVSDIPCINPPVIRSIIQSYETCGRDALSTWVPASLVNPCRGSMPHRQQIHGTESCPAGINILRGDRIDLEQEEFCLCLDEPCLALNVNTHEDLIRTELFLASQSPG